MNLKYNQSSFKTPTCVNDMITSCTEYKHDIQAKHISVVLRNGKPISNYKYNYLRSKIIGLNCGSAHAEIVAIKELINLCCNRAGVGKSAVNNLIKSKWKCYSKQRVLQT